jgi:hypothetical protein
MAGQRLDNGLGGQALVDEQRQGGPSNDIRSALPAQLRKGFSQGLEVPGGGLGLFEGAGLQDLPQVQLAQFAGGVLAVPIQGAGQGGIVTNRLASGREVLSRAVAAPAGLRGTTR